MSKALRFLLLGCLAGAGCAAPSSPPEPDPDRSGEGGATNTKTGGTTGSSSGTGGGGAGAGGSTGAGGATGTGGAGSTATGGAGPAPGGSGGQTGSSSPDGGAATSEAGGGSPTDPATPGATDLAKHKYSKVIKMDTTASGANVPGDVAKYPVAVLLNGMNFDFAQAKPAGEDVRFATMEGTVLPYAIEHWDAAGKQAAIWVKVDVKGNNNSQAIVMHWGNPDATSASSSKTVFNKEDGYLGVYHLNDEGGNTPDGYKDASWNDAHLTGRNMDPATRTPSRIGLGITLSNPGGQGKNQWIGGEGPKFESDFNANATQSISATGWAQGKSFGGYYETVFSKGDTSWTLQRDYRGRMEACTWSGSYHACAITGAPQVGKWTHYMVVQNARNLTLYVDGKRAASTGSFGRTGTHGFAISHNFQAHNDATTGKREWDGSFDEVRVMRGEKDANWALLDFQSQKEGSTFLSFGPTQMK